MFNYYTTQGLRGIGVSCHSTDLNYWFGQRAEMKLTVAKCTSFACTKLKVSAVIKDVPKSVDFCPDCGSALYWERAPVDEKQQRKTRGPRKRRYRPRYKEITI